MSWKTKVVISDSALLPGKNCIRTIVIDKIVSKLCFLFWKCLGSKISANSISRASNLNLERRNNVSNEYLEVEKCIILVLKLCKLFPTRDDDTNEPFFSQFYPNLATGVSIPDCQKESVG